MLFIKVLSFWNYLVLSLKVMIVIEKVCVLEMIDNFFLNLVGVYCESGWDVVIKVIDK